VHRITKAILDTIVGFDLAAHAPRHQTGGADPLSPFTGDMKFNTKIGIGADPVTNKKLFMQMLASDVYGIHIDQTVTPYTGTESPNEGIWVNREIRTPSGDLSLSSWAYDGDLLNYTGLKDTVSARSIASRGGYFHVRNYGDVEGSIADYGYMSLYGFVGGADDYGKDLSAGNTRRLLFGTATGCYNVSEVNKPSGQLQILGYGINISTRLLPTLIAGSLLARAYGVYAEVLGNAAGDSIAYGVYTKVSGALKNYGYYSEDPSLRVAPITSVPSDTPDAGTIRVYGPPGGPYKIYSYLDGAWRSLVMDGYETEIKFPSAEALDAIAVTDPTDTTEKTITVSLPSGAVITRVALAAFITAMNNTANAQKIDVDVKGRLGAGSWTTYFSQDDVIGFPAADGATTGFVPLQDVSALVTAAGTYGFKLTITQSSANSVRYTTQYILIVTYKMS